MPTAPAGPVELTTLGPLLRTSLETEGAVILPPKDAAETLQMLQALDVHAQAIILDPWYNKGVGGIRDDYRDFIVGLLTLSAKISDHVFLWGFPELLAPFVERIPRPLALVAWLTWYYKNSPSVIRGWRSSQMACLHLSRPQARLYPEHFLNAVQLEKQAQGKLRYMPGPTSVIEEPLLVGFVGRNEQTGHPAQKPIRVFEKLLLMTTQADGLVIDPMSGSGTTGAAALKLGRRAILCDVSEEYTQLAESRLEVNRLGSQARQDSAPKPARRNGQRRPVSEVSLFDE
ncbi:MAG: site-specific DNA-methyltransferase [Gemmataceae bacterium]|nr:site-specific DNA-methyltransferase [Gemmataceae bacterium]